MEAYSVGRFHNLMSEQLCFMLLSYLLIDIMTDGLERPIVVGFRVRLKDDRIKIEIGLTMMMIMNVMMMMAICEK